MKAFRPQIYALIAWSLLWCAWPATAEESAAKTLTRTIDPVVLIGAQVPEFAGIPGDRLALFAVTDAGWKPIPWQLDERLGNDYALQNGPGARADHDHGALDANDEIAFLAADSGPRFTGTDWPAGSLDRAEIELIDPIDDGRGYVYLMAFPGPAPRSDVDYVTYHVAENVIETTDYLVGYSPDAPVSINRLEIKPAAGGSGQSVADRQKIRLSATTIWDLLHFSRTENDFRAEVLAYTDGPVRVLRTTKNYLVLFWRIPSPSVRLTSTYWKNGMQFPLSLHLPFRISHFFRDVDMRIYIDSPPDVAGRRFYNEANPEGVSVDGRTDDAERRLDLTPSEWQVVAGSTPEHHEGWFSRQVYDTAGIQVRLPLYYRDEVSTPDPPERCPGCFGCLGFSFANVEELDAGTFAMLVQMYPMSGYRPGDETAYLHIRDAPLRVAVRPAGR